MNTRHLLVLGLALLAAAGLPARAADAARAEEIVQSRCFICHGANGESSSPAFPRLAGQNAAYLGRQLSDFQSGKRKSSSMQPMVEGLTSSEITALGEWFARQSTHIHPVEDRELADVGRFIYLRGNPFSGVAACATCHGTDGHGSASLPRLAGQHAQYLENQIKQFNRRERVNDNAVMHSIASKLSELEIKSVAAYLSGLK